ncbi:MAG: energy-coupling factor transporter ATPase [Christensenellales bacterium]|jgi:energy-coupling factor transport system ATP-binding protein
MPIVLEHLTHTYQPGSAMQATAVKDVSFTVHDGEFLGIIGHTGSGKSTLVQHMNGLLQPTSGRVMVNGIDLADKKTRRDIRRQVGMLFQYPEYQLFEETIRADVAFAPKNLGVPPEQIEDHVRQALEKVGLPYDEFAERSPFELSGGQKRRVALAGILATAPSILILDEPMAGLDPVSREDILSLIKRLNDEGTTIVMVSHSMDDIARLADRVAVMNAGELFAIGTPDEIFSRSGELLAMGLDVPYASRLSAMLRERGMLVPEGLYLKEQLRDYLLDLYSKKHRSGNA